jgi:DNA-binding Xre family transcriptional regulator
LRKWLPIPLELTALQVYRLVTDKPERLSMKVLITLCDILDCTPADLIDPYAESAAGRKTAGEPAAAVTGLKPGLRPERAASWTRNRTPGMSRPR